MHGYSPSLSISPTPSNTETSVPCFSKLAKMPRAVKASLRSTVRRKLSLPYLGSIHNPAHFHKHVASHTFLLPPRRTDDRQVLRRRAYLQTSSGSVTVPILSSMGMMRSPCTPTSIDSSRIGPDAAAPAPGSEDRCHSPLTHASHVTKKSVLGRASHSLNTFSPACVTIGCTARMVRLLGTMTEAAASKTGRRSVP